MKKLILSLIFLICTNAFAEFHYQDCVEIVRGFYYQADKQLVGRVMDKQENNNEVLYKVGDILFGFWIKEADLKKIDSKVCEEAEKAHAN